MDQQRLITAFVELADTLVDEFDTFEFLELLVDHCVGLLDISAAGVLLIDSRGRLEATASSSENVRLMELFTLQNEDGPGRDCFDSGAPVDHPDLGSAMERWPVFAPAAVDQGFLAVHALPMRLRSDVLGTLILFNDTPGDFDSAMTGMAQAMTDIAVIGLVQERSVRKREIVNRQLQTALTGRVLIEQAKGVLIERHGLQAPEAFDRLRRFARSHNQTIRHVAETVIDGRNTLSDQVQLD